MSLLEQAVVRTLAYAAVFNYPLTISEIANYLIGYQLTNFAELNFLFQRHRLPIREERGFFYLAKSDEYKGGSYARIWLTRQQREQRARLWLKQAKRFCWRYLSWIPTLKMVAVTGSTAALNAGPYSDIDLLIVASGGQVWLTRALVLMILQVKSQRVNLARAREENTGKFCLNVVVNETNLAWKRKNLYLANEIARMKPVLVREGTYTRFIQANNWVWDFLPNWQPEQVARSAVDSGLKYLAPLYLFGEPLARWYQLRKDKRNRWQKDYGPSVLREYNRLLAEFI